MVVAGVVSVGGHVDHQYHLQSDRTCDIKHDVKPDIKHTVKRDTEHTVKRDIEHTVKNVAYRTHLRT